MIGSNGQSKKGSSGNPDDKPKVACHKATEAALKQIEGELHPRLDFTSSSGVAMDHI